MTDDQDFVQAILSRPDDDTVRLVYADWLDERGDVRGEFLRLSLELARHTSKSKKYALVSERLEAIRPGIDPEWAASVGRLHQIEMRWRGGIAGLAVNDEWLGDILTTHIQTWVDGGYQPGWWLGEEGDSALRGIAPGRSVRRQVARSCWANVTIWRETVAWSDVQSVSRPFDDPTAMHIGSFVFRRADYDRVMEKARGLSENIRRIRQGR
jgi:uncharacterized protein (TIGR02996 family)